MTERRLLMTTTGEPYQPVRITYAIPGRGYVCARLRKLACMEEDRAARSFVIWLDAEARELDLGTPEAHIEAFNQRVVLGVIRFPKSRAMTMQVRSSQRAIELAKLMRGVLGPRVDAVRMRVVNRWFAAEELTGELDELDRVLDQNVTVIRPEELERAMEAALASATTPADKRRALEEFHASRANEDVPLVEDFPLHPEEETEDMSDVKNVLNFRFLRAGRRWKGEEVTLRQVIEEAVAAHGLRG